MEVKAKKKKAESTKGSNVSLGIRGISGSNGFPVSGNKTEVYIRETGEIVSGVKNINIMINPGEFVTAIFEIEIEKFKILGV
jgi:hypothetical protein